MEQKVIWIINQYASTPSTGFGGRHYYLASELAAKGHKVYLVMASYTHILRSPRDVSDSFEFSEENGINIVWIKMPRYVGGHSKKRMFNWFSFAAKLLQLPKQIKDKPDVILYSSLSLIGFLGANRLAKKLKVRLVFEVRDIWPMSLVELGGYSEKHPFVRFLQWVEDKAYRDADAVISNLKYAVEHMQSRGMSPDKFTWIPNGFSLSEVRSAEPLTEQTRAALPKDKFVVGYAGSLGLANVLSLVLMVAERLLDNEQIVFVLLGGGVDKENLVKQAEAKQLTNVIFLDSIPKKQVQSFLSECDVLWLGLKKARLFEFGVSMNKLFDYLYSARPIIYAVDSGNYSPVAEANAGIKVEAENVDHLEEAVLTLFNMAAKDREVMGANGRKLALERYEYKQLSEKLERVLFPGHHRQENP